MTHEPATARAVTKTVSINRAVSDVFAYLSDLNHWPEWAIVNIKATRPRPGEDWWDVATADGPALIRLRSDAAHGILDHDFRDPDAGEDAYATVPARVIPNGEGAEFMMTIVQPPGVADAFFDDLLQAVDIELARLKEILEARP